MPWPSSSGRRPASRASRCRCRRGRDGGEPRVGADGHGVAGDPGFAQCERDQCVAIAGDPGQYPGRCARDAGTACSQLFALTAPAKGPKPSTTLEALLNIAHNPTTNVQQIFALGDAVRPYQPYLLPQHGPDSSDYEQRLDGFTLAVKFNATGRLNASGEEECPFGGTGNIAFDQNGYVWITNNVVQGTAGSTRLLRRAEAEWRTRRRVGGTPTRRSSAAASWARAMASASTRRATCGRATSVGAVSCPRAASRSSRRVALRSRGRRVTWMASTGCRAPFRTRRETSGWRATATIRSWYFRTATTIRRLLSTIAIRSR